MHFDDDKKYLAQIEKDLQTRLGSASHYKRSPVMQLIELNEKGLYSVSNRIKSCYLMDTVEGKYCIVGSV